MVEILNTVKSQSTGQKSNLEELLEAAGKMMTSNLRLKLIDHPGELGTGREQIIRDFLAAYLPKRFRVATGFAFDCNGKVSKQLDIVIIDGNICPIFEIPGGKLLFPCEAIVAAGEVKSSVSSRAKIREALDGLIDLKSLDRSAKGMAYDSKNKEYIDHHSNYLHQIFTFLIITGKSLGADLVAETIMDESFLTPISQMPNAILALDQYLVTYCCDDGICPNPMHARGVSCQKAMVDVLLRFYIMLGRAIDVTSVSSFPFWQYLSSYQNMPSKVIYDTYENPPRFLASWAPASRKK